MTISIYIRPLVVEDALTSYLWRNDPQIWAYTMKKMTRYITTEIETAWLQGSLGRTDQANFAICVKELDTYIGNIRLVDIQDQKAEIHLFIGNKLFWRKGVGYQAIILILIHGFLEINLENIWLRVHPANISALRVYEKTGFEITGHDNEFIIMNISREKFLDMEESNKP
jgi:RimJ/RimL family protein N-acetyltransferase